MTTTQTCDCCGGKLPSKEIWEANRDAADDCDGSTDAEGRCRAFSRDELWAKKHLYYVSTDSGSHAEPFEFDSLAEALEDFGCPANVTDEDSFVEWLERVGGYGFIEIDDERVAEVKS